jgi:hypothetical protein
LPEGLFAAVARSCLLPWSPLPGWSPEPLPKGCSDQRSSEDEPSRMPCGQDGFMTTPTTCVRQTLRAVSLVGVAAAVMTFGTACASSSGYKDGPAYKDCGQEIPNPAGGNLEDFSPDGSVEPDAIVELVASCSVGAQVAISPREFVIVDAIHTKDGAYQAVKIEFHAAPGQAGTLTVSQQGRRLGQMTLLTQYVAPNSGEPSFCDPLPHDC